MIISNKAAFYLVSIFIIGIVFLLNIRINKGNNTFLEKSNTDSFRGIAIMCIVFHHIIQRIDNPGILIPFRGVGYLFVSSFFFLSGYGLVISYKRSEDYLKDFFRKRLSKIYLPFIVVNIVNLLINILYFKLKYSFKQFLFELVGLKLMSSAMWYIIAIAFWYVAFYIVFRFVKKEYVTKILFLTSLVYIILCYYIGLSKNWYDTALIFPIGVFVGLYKSKVKSFIEDNYNKIVFSSLTMFILLFMLNYGKTDFASIIIRIFSSVAFTIVFITMLLKVDVSRNKVSLFLGTISFEIFLIHDRMLGILNQSGYVTVASLIYYLFIIIVLSVILNRSIYYINKKLKCI